MGRCSTLCIIGVIAVSDVRYGYIVDQQPIGKLLFRQWCESKRSQYHRYLKFLEVTERYDVETDEQRVELAATIRRDFMAGSEGGEPLILPEVGIEQVRKDALLLFQPIKSLRGNTGLVDGLNFMSFVAGGF